MYEESQTKEFGIDFDKVFEKNRRAEMTTKPMKPIVPPNNNSIKASKVNKQTIVDALVNLENIADMLLKKQAVLDDALRRYIHFKKDADSFGSYMEDLAKKRQEKIKNGDSSKEQSK